MPDYSVRIGAEYEAIEHSLASLPRTDLFRLNELEFAGVAKLNGYLGFRHFFSHAYALDLIPGRLEQRIDVVYDAFKRDIASYRQ